MVEFVNESSGPEQIDEMSIKRFARVLDQIGSRGPVLTDACVRAIGHLALRWRSRVWLGIAIDRPCIALDAPDGAIRKLRARLSDLSMAPDAPLQMRGLPLEREWEQIRQELELFSQGLDQESVNLCRQLSERHPYS